MKETVDAHGNQLIIEEYHKTQKPLSTGRQNKQIKGRQMGSENIVENQSKSMVLVEGIRKHRK